MARAIRPSGDFRYVISAASPTFEVGQLGRFRASCDLHVSRDTGPHNQLFLSRQHDFHDDRLRINGSICRYHYVSHRPLNGLCCDGREESRQGRKSNGENKTNGRQLRSHSMTPYFCRLNPEPICFGNWPCSSDGKNGAIPFEHRSAIHL